MRQVFSWLSETVCSRLASKASRAARIFRDVRFESCEVRRAPSGIGSDLMDDGGTILSEPITDTAVEESTSTGISFTIEPAWQPYLAAPMETESEPLLQDASDDSSGSGEGSGSSSDSGSGSGGDDGSGSGSGLAASSDSGSGGGSGSGSGSDSGSSSGTPPAIQNFDALFNEGVLTVTGLVVDDVDPTGLVVDFGDLLAGYQATVGDNDQFVLTIPWSSSDHGSISANVTDATNLTSADVFDYV